MEIGRGGVEGGEGSKKEEVKGVSSLLSNRMLLRSLRVSTHPCGDPPVVVNIVRSSLPVLPHFPPWRKVWVLRYVGVRCVGVRCVRVR